MSREVIDELIDTLSEIEKDDFPDLLESVVEYGFADENELCTLFEIDDSELDELLCSSTHLTEKKFKSYTNKLVGFLKKARKSYERMYYSDKAR